MDFFEKQADARRRSGLLISYFLLAILAMVLILNLLIFLSFKYFSKSQQIHLTPDYWMQGPFWWVAGGVVLTVLAGSIWRHQELRGGGAKVAEMLGAQALNMDARDPLSRRYINIAEEMSIASGIPVPRLFILNHEQGINAFVAGYSLEDMTLTVSQGALEQLDRDELQGVIAHEFSHIQNADTRLNLRIIALLAGILLIGSIGGFLCRMGWANSFGRRRYGTRRSYSSRDKGSGALVATGAALFVVGYTGLFCGRLIQAAVSRQREWLADATAIQFTRQSTGIAGALYKIYSNTDASYLTHTSKAQEVNHMCFGEALRLQSWWASHPPLQDRIKAIDPLFLTKRRAADNAAKVQGQQSAQATGVGSHLEAAQTASAFAGTTGTGAPNVPAHEPIPFTSSQSNSSTPAGSGIANKAASLVGTPPHENYAKSHQLLNRLNGLFGEQLHEKPFAETLLYAMVLKESAPTVIDGLKAVNSQGKPITQLPLLHQAEQKLRSLGNEEVLTLLEIITGVLKQHPAEQQQQIATTLKEIITADRRTTFTEFIIQTFIEKHLNPSPPGKIIGKLDQVLPALNLLLSMFARLGAQDQQAAERLFDQVNKLHLPLNPLTFQARISGNNLGQAVGQLARLNTHLKPILIDACLECISADGKVVLKEYQLLRTVVEMLDCPMPPLFDLERS